MSVVRLCLCAALALGLGAAPVVGQTIRGAVVDADVGDPVAGAVVGLLDEDGEWIAGTLARPDGRFILRVPEPGHYRISARATGRAPAETDAFEVELGVAVDRTLRVRARGSALADLVADADRDCEARPDATDAGARLWHEAQTALVAASLSREAPGVGFHAERHRREIDVERGWVRSQAIDTTWSFRHQPFRTASRPDVRSSGYAPAAAPGATVYSPPDIDELRSFSFRSSHCFRPVMSDDGRVGLAFEPTSDHGGVPEIEGVLWIDAATSELLSVEFDFTGGAAAPADDRFGGELAFRRLDNGLRVVHRWRVRAPIAASTPDAGSIATVRETGGALLRVSGLGAVYALRPPTGTVEGRLVSPAGSPIAGAQVRLAGTGYAATTDANGEFRLTDVLEGRYGLLWRSAAGSGDESTARQPREIEVREADVTVARIRVPGAAAASSPPEPRDCAARSCRPDRGRHRSP